MEQALSDCLAIPESLQERAVTEPYREFRERDGHEPKTWLFREDPVNQVAQSIHTRQYYGNIEQHRVESGCGTSHREAKEHAFGRRNGQFRGCRHVLWK